MNNNEDQPWCNTTETQFGQTDSIETSIPESDDYNETNLIINYLPQSMKDKELYELFVTQGPIEYSKIIRDYRTGYSFGFGFVKFYKAADAAKAHTILNGVQFRNKFLKVSYAGPPGQDKKNTNLYVTNLPKNVTEDAINKVFGEYGTILTRKLLLDKTTGLPTGVAFVRYTRRDEAEAAIENLHGKILEGCTKPIGVEVAQEYGKQRAWKAFQARPWYKIMRSNIGSADMRPFSLKPSGRGRRMPPGQDQET